MKLEAGKELVKLARHTVKDCFEKKKFEIKVTEKREFKVKKGVFVSIHTFPEKNLRGCIGFFKPIFSVWEGTQRAAFSSAFEDPRFEPLREEELDKIIFEVSILTEPKLIQVNDYKEYFKKIKIGKDGLVLNLGPFSSLLLPQVWELIPTTEKFLESLCVKAGLMEDSWQDKNAKIFRFRVKAFKEVKPNGEIEEVNFMSLLSKSNA